MFLCGNDEDLSESGYCSVRELRGLLTNRWDGVEVSLEEVGEVHEMIHENDSDSDSDSDSEEEEEPSATDTRPLINKEWIEQNPERWEELQEKPEHCPVCFESEGVLWDGRLNLIEGDDTRCTHWFCHECFEHIQGMTDGMRRRCPMCKDQW